MTHPLNKPGISWSVWFFGDRRRSIKPVAICEPEELAKWHRQQAAIEADKEAKRGQSRGKKKQRAA